MQVDGLSRTTVTKWRAKTTTPPARGPPVRGHAEVRGRPSQRPSSAVDGWRPGVWWRQRPRAAPELLLGSSLNLRQKNIDFTRKVFHELVCSNREFSRLARMDRSRAFAFSLAFILISGFVITLRRASANSCCTPLREVLVSMHRAMFSRGGRGRTVQGDRSKDFSPRAAPLGSRHRVHRRERRRPGVRLRELLP